MPRWSDCLLLVLLAVVFGGCAPTPRFIVQVDAIASPSAIQKTSYILLPGNEGVTWDQLQFQEFAGYLAHVLQSSGYAMADTVEDAEVAIVLFYGIGDPETNYYTYSLPVWGQTGIYSSTTSGNAYLSGNSASYSSTTTYTPSYGITGYQTHVGSYTQYFRYAYIVGYDWQAYKSTEAQLEVWKTSITSTGSSDDLRRVFPIMIAAAAPNIGKNTGQKVEVVLYETDPAVQEIRNANQPGTEAP